MPSLTDLPFTLADAICTLVGLCLLILILLPSGILLCSYLEPQKFNQKSSLELFLHSSMLSICFCPIVFYLLWKLHFLAVAGFILGTWFGLIWRIRFLRSLRTEKTHQSPKVLKLLVIVIPAIFFLTIVDWQQGSNLYLSVVCYDYEKHVAIANCISQANFLPPQNPMYSLDSKASGLFYYYFWFLFPACISKISLGFVGPYPAVIAGTMFSSLAFLGLVINLWQELFEQKNYRIPLFLLFVSGLDALIVAPINFNSLYKFGFQPFTSTEAWSMDQVSNFMHMLIWVPHHVSGAIAALTGIVFASKAFIESESISESISNEKNKFLIASAVCFASSFGLSIYLAFVGVSAICVYALVCAIKNKSPKYLIGLALILGMAFALALPFELELQSDHSNLRPISIAVRTSGLLRYFLDPNETGINSNVKDQLGLDQPTTAYPLESLLLLIIDYPIEFGFFLFGAIFFWFDKLKSKTTSVNGLLPICLFSTSFFICTFLRSAIHNNDLGWRGLIPAQLMLLFWSALYVKKYLGQPKALILLIVLAIIGLGTTLYEFYLLRFSLQDKARVMLESKSERNYYVRKAYEHLQNRKDISIIQANPGHDRDPYFGLYSNHRTLCSDKEYGPLFGIVINQYNKFESSIEELFASNYSYEKTRKLAIQWKIDALLIKSDDPAFENNWSIKPDFENKYVKVYLFK